MGHFVVRVWSLKVVPQFRGRWNVIAGFGIFAFSGAKALSQGHSPWLLVGGEPTDTSSVGPARVLVLYDNGWQWLDPENAWDRSKHSWLSDIGADSTTGLADRPPLNPNLKDDPAIPSSSPETNWFGMGVVAIGMVAGFGGIYLLVNRSDGSAPGDGGPEGNGAGGDGGGTGTPMVLVTSSLTIAENYAGWLTTARNEGFAVAQVEYFLSGPDEDFFFIDQQTGAVETRSGVVLDYDGTVDQDANNQFEVVIQAADQEGNVAGANLNITLTDVDDEAPVIIDPASAFVWPEGQVGVIGSFEVSDIDTAREALSFVLTGADSENFSIDQDAVLRLNQSLDFEHPVDENRDGVFDLVLKVQDPAGNVSDAFAMDVRLSNQWEPMIVSNVSFEHILRIADVSLPDEASVNIDHTAVFGNLDFDFDGDTDGVLLSIDMGGLNGAPSMTFAAFEDPNLASHDQLLWSYGAEVLDLTQIGNIGSVSASLVAEATNGFQFSVAGNEGQLEIVITQEPWARSVVFTTSNDRGTYRLYSDETGDAAYDHFWEITSSGVLRGGDNEELPTAARVSSSLTASHDLLFAAGDVNADHHHDILTFNTVTGGIDAWIMDNDSGQLSRALGAENPYAFTAFPEGFPEPANIQQFVFAAAPSEASIGAIPDLIFTGADALWVLAG